MNPKAQGHSSNSPLKKGLKWVLIILSGTVVFCCAGSLLVAILSYREFQNSPKLVEGAPINPSANQVYSLSPDQNQIIGAHGQPDSFTITFYREEFAPDYKGEVREEIWRYYEIGKSFTFYNGSLTHEEPITDSPAYWQPVLYRPDQFVAYTSFESVLASASIVDYFELPLEPELIKRGTLYYGPGLTFGLVDDRLIYVETISMTESGGQNE